MKFTKGQIPWNKGKHIYLGGGFKKGHTPWLKGTKGLVKPNSGSFKKGDPRITGKNNFNWKGGKFFDGKYIRVTMTPKWQYEHIIIMEKKLNRPIAKNECVHHINHNTTDNRIENLMLITKKKHSFYHANKRWHPSK